MGVAQQMDCRNWDEDSYRDSISHVRETLSRTVFRTAFAPNPNPNPNSDQVVTASSDGAIEAYSISACLVISPLMYCVCLLYAFNFYSDFFLLLFFGFAGDGLWKFEEWKVSLVYSLLFVDYLCVLDAFEEIDSWCFCEAG